MQSRDYFELFNHFLTTGDAEQMLQAAETVEIFGSAGLAGGKIYVGENAPDRFREFIKKSKGGSRIDLRHTDVGSSYGAFVYDLSSGFSKQARMLVIGTREGKLSTFCESKVSL